MRVAIDTKSKTITVYREPSDYKVRDESTFWYHLKLHLIGSGIPLVKVNPSKEYLTSARYMLRSPTTLKKGENYVEIFDLNHQIRDVSKDFKQFGSVELFYGEKRLNPNAKL